MTAGVLTFVTLLFLTGLFEQLPEATLAAIVIAAVIELVDIGSLRRLWRVRTGRVASVYRLTSRADFVAAVGALHGRPGVRHVARPGHRGLPLARSSSSPGRRGPHIAVLAPVGGEPGRPWVDVDRHPDYALEPGVLVVRVEAPLMFANAEFVRSRVRELAAEVDDLRLVVMDGQTTPSIDVTAAGMLVQLRADLRRDRRGARAGERRRAGPRRARDG